MTPSPRRSESTARRFGDPILDAGIAGLAPAYAQGMFDPPRVARHYLQRIEAWNAALGAFVNLDTGRALADAEASAARWSARAARSPLDGVPLAIKSNIAVAGLPWTAGIGAYRDRRAVIDAALVTRLRESGAIILGIVTMDEGALGATGDNPWFGRTANPHGNDHISGGSSGGAAAAVAAGLCAGAIGTDTFGSVRIPASYCGVFGHKPGHGVIDMAGITPLAGFFDTPGFLARSAADCLALSDLFVDGGAGPVAPTLGICGFEAVADELADIENRLTQRLRSLGANPARVVLAPDPFGKFMKPALLIAEAEGAWTHRDILADPAADISPRLRALLEWGRSRPQAALDDARAAILAGRAALRRDLAPYDAVIMPAMATAAPRGDAADDRFAARFTLTASLAGLPAIVLPFGHNADGLPLSLQIIGRDAAVILDLAAALADPPPVPRQFYAQLYATS